MDQLLPPYFHLSPSRTRTATASLCLWIFAIAFTLAPRLTLAAVKSNLPVKWATGYILVQPKTGLPDASLDHLLTENSGKRLGTLRKLNVHMVAVPPQAEEKVAAALSRHPWIEFAEPDRLVDPVWIPDDPSFGSQWHLPIISAPTAWDSSTGAGIVVAVLDTGVDPDHPDLVGKLVPGWNAYDNNDDWSDVYGHGTKVAGVVAAETNNGIGVASVAPDALIMPVRISQPDGYAYWSTVATALTWAADHGAEVANISYSVTGSYTVDSAARYFRNAGGVVVASAGNTGGEVLTIEDPNIITVSATGSSDTLASWSSYGEMVDLSAPGSSILTTANGGGYASVSGTSFSSPCTAAVVALMKAANPSLSPERLETLLEETAVDLGTNGWDPYYGYGRVDAAAAVTAALESDTSDTTAPLVTLQAPLGGTVSGLVAVEISAVDQGEIEVVELWINGMLYGSDSTAPYSFVWDSNTAEEGINTLTARAIDAAGNVGTSSSVQVTVDNLPDPVDSVPPTVNLVSPVNDSIVEGLIKIVATASDESELFLLQIALDGSVLCGGNASSLTCSWNAKKAAAGDHTIEARAQDATGNQNATSITVRIENDTTSAKTPPGLDKKTK